MGKRFDGLNTEQGEVALSGSLVLMKITRTMATNSFLLTSIVLIVYTFVNMNILSFSGTRVNGEAILNAISYPQTSAWPWITGLTSWSKETELVNSIYFVELINHLPALAAKQILSIGGVFRFQRILDVAIIAGSISLFTDLLAKHLIPSKNTIKLSFIKITVIAMLVISPWTAYMLFRSDWYEPLHLLVMIASLTAFGENKFWTGTVLLCTAYFIHYQYAAFISLYLLYCTIRSYVRRGPVGMTVNGLPPIISRKLTNTSSRLAWSLIGLLAFPLLQIRRITAVMITGSGINAIGGSSAFSRIGVDGGLHAAGIGGSLQFLGGYKWSTCFTINNVGLSSLINTSKITALSIINCELTMLSLMGISIASIAGI